MGLRKVSSAGGYQLHPSMANLYVVLLRTILTPCNYLGEEIAYSVQNRVSPVARGLILGSEVVEKALIALT